MMMDKCQDENDATFLHGGGHHQQRPLLVGSFLLGIGLSCLFFVYPSMMISDMAVSESKTNHLMALICVMAALASPLLALGVSGTALMGVILAFVVFVACHIFQFVGLGWNYFAAGPLLAFIQWGHFSLLAGSKVEVNRAQNSMISKQFQNSAQHQNSNLAIHNLLLGFIQHWQHWQGQKDS